MERLERKNIELQAEIAALKRDNEESRMALRREQAALNTVLNGVRTEIQSQRGKMEEINFRLDRHLRDYEDWRKQQELALEAAKRAPSPSPVPPVASPPAVEMPTETTVAKPAPVAQMNMTEDNLYAAGIERFNAADYTGARDIFDKFLKTYPASSHCDNAYFWIGETYFRENRYEKAILAYQEVIDKFPGGNKFPAALLKQGMAFSKINDDINARLIYKRLLADFPDSVEARDAGRLLQEL